MTTAIEEAQSNSIAIVGARGAQGTRSRCSARRPKFAPGIFCAKGQCHLSFIVAATNAYKHYYEIEWDRNLTMAIVAICCLSCLCPLFHSACKVLL